MAWPIVNGGPAFRRGRTSRTLGLLAGLLAAATAVTAVAQLPAPARPSTVEVMLVRNALTAVNHANISGNYTVLRDLGSATFREKNSAAQLATIFQNLREKKVDLSPTLVLDPQFTQPPGLNQAGQLQLVGFFPTQPLQVHFAVVFQRVDAGWMIYEISLGTTETRPQTAAAATQPQYSPQPQLSATPQYSPTQPQYSPAPQLSATPPQYGPTPPQYSPQPQYSATPPQYNAAPAPQARLPQQPYSR